MSTTAAASPASDDMGDYLMAMMAEVNNTPSSAPSRKRELQSEEETTTLTMNESDSTHNISRASSSTVKKQCRDPRENNITVPSISGEQQPIPAVANNINTRRTSPRKNDKKQRCDEVEERGRKPPPSRSINRNLSSASNSQSKDQVARNNNTQPSSAEPKQQKRSEEEEEEMDTTTNIITNIDNSPTSKEETDSSNNSNNNDNNQCCRFCNDPFWKNKILYKCGTVLSKYFPKSKYNPNPGWYNGTIKVTEEEEEEDDEEQEDEESGFWYEIHYEDGDIEILSQDDLKQQVMDRRQKVKILNSTEAKTKSKNKHAAMSKYGKRKDQNWLEKYDKLKKFKVENGHCRVPFKYEPDPSLGSWVNHQRGFYKKSTLPADRVAKLNELGFDWFIHGNKAVNAKTNSSTKHAAAASSTSGKRKDQNWLEKYDKLKKFKVENGHCRVPFKYDPDPSLGRWVNHQRTFYKKSTLPADRVAKLNELGFDWSITGKEGGKGNEGGITTTNEEKWMEKYIRLVKFKADNGHCSIPKSTHADLGKWVEIQRQRNRKKLLTAERIEKLNEIGFEWDGATADVKWLQKLKELKEFKEEFGHFRVPYNYAKDPSLSSWMTNQRGSKKKNKLAADRVEKLDEIGFNWVCDNPDTKWLEKYDRLKAFKEEFGHCRVPFTYGPDRSLGGWVSNQRCLYKNNKLAADRVEKLNEIEFAWVCETPDAKWLEKYDRLKAFREHFGDCRVPFNYGPDLSLASWVSNQRSLQKKGKLAGDRLEKLNEIGFEWDPPPQTPYQKWQEVYERLIEFKAENGHCRVPTNYDPDPSLSTWVSKQRTFFRKKTLQADRVEKLNDIGFDWAIYGNPETQDDASRFCTVCADPARGNQIFYKCGTRLSKYFPASDSNPDPGWYDGTIHMHHVSIEEEQRERIWNEIHYDDGDIENLPQDELKLLVDNQAAVLNPEAASNSEDRSTVVPTPATSSNSEICNLATHAPPAAGRIE